MIEVIEVIYSHSFSKFHRYPLNYGMTWLRLVGSFMTLSYLYLPRYLFHTPIYLMFRIIILKNMSLTELPLGFT